VCPSNVWRSFALMNSCMTSLRYRPSGYVPRRRRPASSRDDRASPWGRIQAPQLLVMSRPDGRDAARRPHRLDPPQLAQPLIAMLSGRTIYVIAPLHLACSDLSSSEHDSRLFLSDHLS
jgi:hypothetical protein